MKKILIASFLLLPFSAKATRIDLNYEPDEFSAPLASEVRGCSSAQTAKVREAEKTMALRLDQLLRDWILVDLVGVKRDYVDAENRQWVEGSPMNQSYQTYWQDMGKVLRLMKDKADKGLNFQCQTARERQCDAGTIAYVMVIFGKPRQMIYLCPSFFEEGSYSTTILHELSHYAAGTEDFALDWWNLAKSDLKRGARDAYHVEKFMNREVAKELKETIWMWWWPKKKPTLF